MVMRLSVAAGSGGVLAEGDDDVVAEGLELSSGVVGLAVVRMERPTARPAFFRPPPPGRVDRRRNRSPRKVSVLAPA
jgi:hypothetical protein